MLLLRPARALTRSPWLPANIAVLLRPSRSWCQNHTCASTRSSRRQKRRERCVSASRAALACHQHDTWTRSITFAAASEAPFERWAIVDGAAHRSHRGARVWSRLRHQLWRERGCKAHTPVARHPYCRSAAGPRCSTSGEPAPGGDGCTRGPATGQKLVLEARPRRVCTHNVSLTVNG